jgi:hypothetical protein
MKKKTVLMGILLFCVNIMAFPDDGVENSAHRDTGAKHGFEGRLSFGFEFGNTFEKRTDGGIDIETYLSSPGIDLSGYLLWNNFGFFFNNSFLFPNLITTNIDGYDYFFQYNFIIGPAFKIGFTEKLDMTLGLGFSLGPTVGKYNDNSLSLFNVGIGGDIGLSYFINKSVYINIGSILSYHFFNMTNSDTGEYEIDSDGDREEIENVERSKNYNSAGIRPYIRIGWRIKI